MRLPMIVVLRLADQLLRRSNWRAGPIATIARSRKSGSWFVGSC